MAKKTLTNEELDKHLFDFMNKIDHLTHLEGVFFHHIYFTGCRAEEILQIERWKIVEKNVLELTTSKTDAKRYITPEMTTDIFYKAVEKKINLFDRYNYQYLRRIFLKHCPISAAYIDDHPAKLHIFRHNRAKQLHESGASEKEIDDFFGWKQESTKWIYIDSKVRI